MKIELPPPSPLFRLAPIIASAPVKIRIGNRRNWVRICGLLPSPLLRLAPITTSAPVKGFESWFRTLRLTTPCTILWIWPSRHVQGYIAPIRKTRTSLPSPSLDIGTRAHQIERGLSLVAGDVYLTGWFWVDLLIFFPHLLANYCSPLATNRPHM